MSSEETDSVSSLCFDFGAAGVEEQLHFQQPDLVYEATVVDLGVTALNVYFETPPSPAVVESLREKFPETRVRLFQEPSKDWMEEWKKGFTAFSLVGPFWVVPSWLPVPPTAKQPLFIDPGMAFGTGTHATTKLCSHLIAEVLTTRKITSALDVGTGTAILAMLAKLLGVKRVLGNDIDPEARRVARENLERNKLSDVEIVEESVNEISDQFDLVIANIVDGVLLRLRSQLLARTAPGGILIVSGVLAEREPVFLKAFMGRNLRLLERRAMDEWLAYLFLYETVLD